MVATKETHEEQITNLITTTLQKHFNNGVMAAVKFIRQQMKQGHSMEHALRVLETAIKASEGAK